MLQLVSWMDGWMDDRSFLKVCNHDRTVYEHEELQMICRFTELSFIFPMSKKVLDGRLFACAVSVSLPPPGRPGLTIKVKLEKSRWNWDEPLMTWDEI
jgi:hypothetical protein